MEFDGGDRRRAKAEIDDKRVRAAPQQGTGDVE
jgi:hypothetical protein